MDIRGIRSRIHKDDSGAALAMVLILITFLALWMAALAVLVQTSSASLAKNSVENARRANLVNAVIPQALGKLNSLQLGVDEDNLRCSDYRFYPDIPLTVIPEGVMKFPVNSIKEGRSETETIYVQCKEASKSGLSQPIASFFLTGGALSSGTGITGVDGGLKLDATSSVKLLITGGITNVSGAWSEVNSSTLELKKTGEGDLSPQIIQPSGQDCPALNYDNGSCVCPTWSSEPVIPTSNCAFGADGYTYKYLDPDSEDTEVRSYIDSVLAKTEDVNSLADIPKSCAVTSPIAGSSLYAVQIKPGIINSAGLLALRSLASNSGCGSGTTMSAPAIQFTPGVYRFDFSLAGTPRQQSGQGINTLDFNTSNLKVIGGEAKFIGSEWECDPDKEGVQFQFSNGSYMAITKASLSLCPFKKQPTMVAPSNKNVTSFYWQGVREDPIIEQNFCGRATDGPVTYGITSYGQIFVPAGWLNLCFNGTMNFKMEKGVVARALTMTASGSAKQSGSLAPPSPYNGDRVIQLRIWSETRRQDLGLIQVVIRDYFGRRQGSGYKIITWRAIW